MARFVLLVVEGGGAILASREHLDDDEVERLRTVFTDWKDAEPPQALIVAGCEVVRVDKVELDLAKAVTA